MQKRSLIIEWYHDIRSYKKLIPALKKYPEEIIITADDDVIYDENLIKNLIKTYKKYPNCIIANRVHWASIQKDKTLLPYKKWAKLIKYKSPSHNLFFTGIGGVLYPPHCFYKDILKEDLFVKLCKDTDDIWFWCMALLKNTKIKQSNKICNVKYIDLELENTGLNVINCLGGNNDKNLKLMIEYYPEIINMLSSKIVYKNKFRIFEKFISIRNTPNKKHKVITVLGLKIKLKRRK
ncbi:MAG: hypothetical protein IJE43_21805 [Alphaproteobacteria bacterium]|nr:hypothetical protein [Alphaproteobacteria bacterium]